MVKPHTVKVLNILNYVIY